MNRAVTLLCASFFLQLASTIGEPIKPLSAPRHSPFTIDCTHGTRKVIWIKSPEGRVVSIGPSLRFESLEIQDTGHYACHEAKKHLDLEFVQDIPLQRFYLDVKRPMEDKEHIIRIRRSSPTKKEISVKVNGRKITLECSLGEGKDVPGGINVDMVGEENDERYSCVCANCSTKSSEENQRSSSIGFAPMVSSPELRMYAKTEETVYFTCNAKAEPMPVFTWYKISNSLDSGAAIESLESRDLINQSKKHAFLLEFIPDGFQSKLEIKNVSANDFGSYLCHVENGHGVGIVIFNVHDSSNKKTSSSANMTVPVIFPLLALLSLLYLNPSTSLRS